MFSRIFPRRRDTIMSKLDDISFRLQQLETRMSALDNKIADLTADVEGMVGTVNSAILLINGISDRVAAAVAAALAAGATTEQLEAIDGLGRDLRDSAEGLATAVAANTPAA